MDINPPIDFLGTGNYSLRLRGAVSEVAVVKRRLTEQSQLGALPQPGNISIKAHVTISQDHANSHVKIGTLSPPVFQVERYIRSAEIVVLTKRCLC